MRKLEEQVPLSIRASAANAARIAAASRALSSLSVIGKRQATLQKRVHSNGSAELLEVDTASAPVTGKRKSGSSREGTPAPKAKKIAKSGKAGSFH